MSVRYIIDTDKIQRQALRRDPKTDKSEYHDHDAVDASLVAKAFGVSVNTGLVPPGLRLFDQRGTETQLVLEMPPGVNRICVSESEYDAKVGNYTEYLVAQPWRVVIARYQSGNMLGARMFYRYRPLYTLDDELYHANLANVNCMGYNNTSVGWVCFYADRIDTTRMEWPERIMRLAERCSGGEAYSLGNMRGIDGPAMYRKAPAPARLNWRPKASTWETHTNKHGVELAMAEGTWKPIMVGGVDDQLTHSFDEKAVPLTLGMALTGRSPMAYNDRGYFPSTDGPAEKPNSMIYRKPAAMNPLYIGLTAAYNNALAEQQQKKKGTAS